MAMRFLRSSRLAQLVGIGVDRMGDTADELADSAVLRLENLDTDLRPCAAAIAATKRAVDLDTANSYLPFLGQEHLRRAAAAHVTRISGVDYDWRRCCVISAGGLSGILNVLLAAIEPGDEVILADPIYVGLLNRVRLAGGVPRLAPMIPSRSGWRLDLDAFRGAAESPNVRAALMMSPSMPTGAVLTRREWEAVAEVCCAKDLLLIYDAAMERILFDGREVLHPASLPGMADRTATVGSASKELRMIGWRVGWVVGSAELINDVAMVSISNVVSQVGIAMEAAAIGLEASDSDVRAATAEWQRRRDLILRELEGIVPAIPPHGGWSLLLDCSGRGLDGERASRLMLERGGIAATPMTNWGGLNASRYLRFVFANEPCERLVGIGARVERALKA
jgi:N-succinyldiaminopimelate aminotransferase